MPTPDFTVDELRRTFGLDAPNPDALTVKEIAKMLNCSPPTARRHIYAAVERGEMRETNKLVPTRLGNLRSVPAYILIKETDA